VFIHAVKQPFKRLSAHPVFPEIVKFTVVGGAAYSSDVIVFNVLKTGTGLGPLTAKALSLTLTTFVAFFGNRYWTYRERNAGQGAGEVSAQGLVFVLVTILGMLIQIAFLGVSHYMLGLTSLLADNLSGNVVGMAAATVFRFWGYRTLVFRHDGTAGASGNSRSPAPSATYPERS
jgi:putative flippase GtrA